jgi:hypothetical protein
MILDYEKNPTGTPATAPPRCHAATSLPALNQGNTAHEEGLPPPLESKQKTEERQGELPTMAKLKRDVSPPLAV